MTIMVKLKIFKFRIFDLQYVGNNKNIIKHRNFLVAVTLNPDASVIL